MGTTGETWTGLKLQIEESLQQLAASDSLIITATMHLPPPRQCQAASQAVLKVHGKSPGLVCA